MNIVILGAGNIGSYLALTLSKENHNVTVIDPDAAALEKVSGMADVAIRVGSGTDWTLIEELMELSPDLFVAVASNDETNLVACTIAKNLGFPKTVARISQTSYLNRSRLDFGRLFFVDHLIAPEIIVAHDIFTCVLNPGNLAVENFAHGAVQMRTLTIPKDWSHGGKKIAELGLHDNLLVGVIERKLQEKEDVIFPRGNDLLMPLDEVTMIGDSNVMAQLPTYFGLPQKKVQSVTVVGGSAIGVELCRILQEHEIGVHLIEKDLEKCRKLAEELPNVTVFNQDGTDLNFIRSEKIHLSDVFVACTRSSETNILAAAVAKQAGCDEVIAVISEISLAPLLRNLGIFYTISERESFAKRVHSILLEENVISVSSLYENRAKIMEIKVSSDSQIVGIPIADLSSYLPQDFIIALIENKGRIMIAKGSHILAPGDTVILICSPKHIAELEKIF